MRYHVDSGTGERLVEVRPGELLLDGVTESCEVDILPGEKFLVRFRGRTATGFARRAGGRWKVSVEGRLFDISVDDERAHHIRGLATVSAPIQTVTEIRAPMPGLIVRIEVVKGQAVEAGEGLVVIEAMKMENELRASSTGIVTRVHVEPGMTVARDDALVTIERESA
ncbi:MAG: biotin/lipoyl-binding protein [Gemmatimonadales bacterium]|nr:MAG: biotin/lipoyl-binding protein [Gemmatimonadales bacterium]